MLSTSHLIIVLVIVLLIFGAKKVPTIMADVAKGVKAFKKGVNDEETSDNNKEDPKN